MSLIRSKLEYAAGPWDPHLEYNINELERVQRCAARFVCHDFGPCSSVTQMLSDLGRQQLKDRRKHICLALLFKIIHDIISVPNQDLLLKVDSRTRSSHQFKYRTIHTSTDPYKQSFFFLELYLNGIYYTRTLLIPKPSTNLRVGPSHHPPHPCACPPPAWSWLPAFSWLCTASSSLPPPPPRFTYSTWRLYRVILKTRQDVFMFTWR